MTATIVLVGLALGTYGLKSAAPLLLGGRPLPAGVTRVANLLPAPLLAALVLVSALTTDGSLEIDARLLGVAAAAVALQRRAPFAVVVIAAVAVTALARTL